MMREREVFINAMRALTLEQGKWRISSFSLGVILHLWKVTSLERILGFFALCNIENPT